MANCPQKAGVTVDNISEMWNFMDGGSQTHEYSFDRSNLVLKSGETALVDESTHGQVSYFSGPLFNATPENLAQLECDFDLPPEITGPVYCGWQAWSKLSEFYTWETGNQQWSRLALLMDGSTVKAFEQPLRVTYDKSQTGAGPFYVLDYNSFGDLGGIPGKCVNMDTGDVVSCQNSREIRYVSDFSIPKGHKVTAKSIDSETPITYYVKPLEMEQRMLPPLAGNCDVLTVSRETLPDTAAEAGWVPFTLDSDVTDAISEAPAVIGGVVQ